MKRRPRRGIPAAIAALILVGAGALAAIVAVQILLGEPPWISYDKVATTLHDTRWRDTAVLVAGLVVGVAGLIALLAAVLPGKRTVLPLTTAEVDSGVSRRGFVTTLRTAAAGVDGVAAARIRLGRKKVRAAVRTNRVTTTGIDDAVRTAVERRLTEIGPADALTVHTRVRTTRKVR